MLRYAASMRSFMVSTGDERSEDPDHVAMREHRPGIALHHLEVAARKAYAVLRRGDQLASLSDQTVGVGRSGRFFQLQRLVDEDDELRQVVQPGEPWVVEHQIEILSGAGDALDIPLVGGALA